MLYYGLWRYKDDFITFCLEGSDMILQDLTLGPLGQVLEKKLKVIDPFAEK